MCEYHLFTKFIVWWMLFKHVFVSTMSFLVICDLEITCHHRPCFSFVPPMLVHRCSIVSPSKRWTIDGVTMEYRWSIFGGRAMPTRWIFSLANVFRKKRKRPDPCRYVQKPDLCHVLFMSVGSLFAILCLLSGRTRTVSSCYVFLFLCLGLNLSVILLWLGASA